MAAPDYNDQYGILQYLSPATRDAFLANSGAAAKQFEWGPDQQSAWNLATGHTAGGESIPFAFQQPRAAGAIDYSQYTPLNRWLASNEGAWQEGYKQSFANAIYDPQYGLLMPPGSGLSKFSKETGMSPEIMALIAAAVITAGLATAPASGAAGAAGAGANSAGQIAGGSALGGGTLAGAAAPIVGETAAEIGWLGSAAGAGAAGTGIGAGTGGGTGGANAAGQVVGASAPQQSAGSQLAGLYKGVQPYTSAISTLAQIASGKKSEAAISGAAAGQENAAQGALAAQQAAQAEQIRIAQLAMQQQAAAQQAQLAAQQKAAADALALQQSMAAYQRQVQMQQMAQQTRAQQLAEYQLNRSNQRMPDFGAVLEGIRGSAKQGQSGTMLTGYGGVDPSMLLLGRNTLLGR